MKTSKQIGNEGELEVIGELNTIFLDSNFRPMPGSGKNIPGDVGWTKRTTQKWIQWLNEHKGEIKTEKKCRLSAYVKQCKDQFNSVQNWVIYYRCPDEWNIPGNFLVIQPGLNWAMEQKERVENS